MGRPLLDQCEIFDHNTFFDRFEEDLSSSLRQIRIQSAFVSINRLEKLAMLFSTKLQAGVQICLFVQEPQDWTRRKGKFLDAVTVARLKQFETAVEMLQQLGAHVNIRKKIHAKVAVIDELILWDGSLNILSFGGHTEERMTRWSDREKATAAVELHRLSDCIQCTRPAGSDQQNLSEELDITAASIGVLVKRRRKQLGLSQSELARRIAITRSALYSIEAGRSNPNTALFIKISQALGKTVCWLPAHMLPSIARVIHLNQEI